MRALFGPDGKRVEILPKGRTVRQEGFHIRWIPGEDDESRARIKVWIYLLELSDKGWGGKRIASHLNALKIPSPGAGTARTDGGVEHRVSGKWSPNTVLDLIRNSTIAGLKSYGVRAEGKHRRLGEAGWRYLADRDRNAAEEARIIRNPEHLIVSVPSGTDPSFDPQRLNKIQAKLRKRARSQRGIPRARDLAKYPLSGRVIDLSGGCGSSMYGAVQSGRKLYKCGRNMRTSGAECDNNAVDAEALLAHTLSSILNSVRDLFSRSELEAELFKLANSQLSTQGSDAHHELARIEAKLSTLKEDLAIIGRNLARARDQEIFDEIEAERSKVRTAISELE
jgi:hypothetical protein